jgi:hypothetical protein
MSFLEIRGVNLAAVGVYTIPQAASLVRLPLATVDAIVGPKLSAGGQPRQFPGALSDDAFGIGEPLITFQGLMALWVAAELHDQGIPWPSIRYAAYQASKILQTEHPFTLGTFRTEGRRVFMALEGKGERAPKAALDLLSRQQVFEEVIERSLGPKIVVRGKDGRIQRWYPLGRKFNVVLDPERRFGEPIDPESGIPTSSLCEAFHGEGGNVKAASRWFSTSVKAVRDAVAFEQWLNRR